MYKLLISGGSLEQQGALVAHSAQTVRAFILIDSSEREASPETPPSGSCSFQTQPFSQKLFPRIWHLSLYFFVAHSQCQHLSSTWAFFYFHPQSPAWHLKVLFDLPDNCQCMAWKMNSVIYLHTGLIEKMPQWFESQTSPHLPFTSGCSPARRSSLTGLFCSLSTHKEWDDNEMNGLSCAFKTHRRSAQKRSSQNSRP